MLRFTNPRDYSAFSAVVEPSAAGPSSNPNALPRTSPRVQRRMGMTLLRSCFLGFLIDALIPPLLDLTEVHPVVDLIVGWLDLTNLLVGPGVDLLVLGAEAVVLGLMSSYPKQDPGIDSHHW